MTTAPEPSASNPSGLRWAVYRLLRPFIRPVAWRLRTFMTGRLHEQLAAMTGEMSVLRAELAALRLDVAVLHAASSALDTRAQKMLDDAILTLMLDHDARV